MTCTDTTIAIATAPLRALGDDLNSAFLERDREIRALLVALLAGEHVLFLGDPGTGKSALTQAFAEALSGTSGRYFQRLVTKFSVPEELFGPFSLRGLESDRYERQVDGYLPTAEIAFLDEVFKANSAILNALLTILNERAFDNGTQRIGCPLKIAIGASNELPNNDEGDALDALYDRFVLRRWVEPIKSRDARRRLLRMRGAPCVQARITDEELAAARATVDAVVFSEAAEDALLDLQEALAKECGIAMSDRRLRKAEKLVRAYAALQGKVQADPEDLEILADSLWNKPEERAPVEALILRVCNPTKAEAARVYDAAVELLEGVDLQQIGLNDVAKIANLRSELGKMEATIRAMSLHPAVQEIADDVAAMQREVAGALVRVMQF